SCVVTFIRLKIPVFLKKHVIPNRAAQLTFNFFSSLSFFFPILLFPPALLPVSSSLSVTAALGQPEPTLPPSSFLAPQQCPMATPNQPSPFLSPSATASTPFEAPFPQSFSGTALPFGAAPDTPSFLPNLVGPPISPAALALASPMITPTLKGAHSSSAPLALVALAPHSVQKSSAYPSNPLSSPPSVPMPESASVSSLSAPIASSEPKVSPVQASSQAIPNPKGTPIPPGTVSAVPSNLITPLASEQSGVASCAQIPPVTPLAITSSQAKATAISSSLTSPQNPLSLSLKGPLSPPATLSLSTQSAPVAPSVPPVFLTSPGSHLAPLHQSCVGSAIQPVGQTGANVLSDSIMNTISVDHASIGASYPSQRSVIPPLPSRNEVVPDAVAAFPVEAPASPLALSVDKGPSTITGIASYSPSGSSNAAVSFPLPPTPSLILKGSPDASVQQPLVAQISPGSPGSPGSKEAPVSSIGTTSLVMTNPSTISAVPTTLEVATCVSPPISSGPISSKDSVSYTALAMAPVAPKELPTPQVTTTLGIPVFPLLVSEDPKSLSASLLVKSPTQKDPQTVSASPVGAPIPPVQVGLPTKKDPTLLPLSLAPPKNTPSLQSTSSSLEVSLPPEAILAKKSIVEPLPVAKPACTSAPLGVISPTSIIKTDPYASPDPSALLLKSSLTSPVVATFPLESAATSGVIPTTTASPFLEGAISLAPKSHPIKKGTSTLTTLPLVPPTSEGCPGAPAVTVSPQNVSASPATLALASAISKSEPFPSLPPAAGAKKVHGISHTSALAPVASSPEGCPTEGSHVSVTASLKGTYLTDSSSPLGTSVSPQTKRSPTKKDSAAPTTTITLASVSKSVPAIPDAPAGNLSFPVSPVEASVLPEADLPFQVPKGSLAKKHCPTPPSPKEAPTSPAMASPYKWEPATPFPKEIPTSPAMTPSPKGAPATPFPKESPATTPPKGASTPSAVAPPSPKVAPGASSPKETPKLPAMTPSPKEAPAPLKGASASSSPKKSPAAPPTKGASATPSSKTDPTPSAVTLSSPKGTPKSPTMAPSLKGDPIPPAVALSPKGASAASPPKESPAAIPTKGASTRPAMAPSPKRTSATPSPKGAPAILSPKGASTPSAVTSPSPKKTPTPSAVTPPSPKGAPATLSFKGVPIPSGVALPSLKGASATLSPKESPATPPAKGASTPPAMAPSSPKGAPATPSPKGAHTPSAIAPPSSRESPETPALERAPASTSPKKAPTPSSVNAPSSKGSPATPSTKRTPGASSSKGAPAPSVVVPPSPKESPASETPSPKKLSATQAPKGGPTTPASKEAPISSVSVTCPLGSIVPQASKGPSIKKGSTALKAALVAPTSESVPVVIAPTQKGPPAKKSSLSVCPNPLAKNGTEGPLSPLLAVSAQKGTSPKAPKALPISALKGKNSFHSPKGPMAPPESETSTPLAAAASEKVLPKAGSASLSPAPTPSVSLPLAPSPVPPLLPKQQPLPSSPGLVLESPCKPSAPADEDELPPLIPPDPISGGVPFQSVLINMPTPKPAGIPAPTPSAKQPVLKNNKGI
ncbi:nascent polypeptide-associated complex subunit alpha, muscle-specific form-like, partial [Rousettus aegyptiacus]|uniref:nascent polypeptide-associated complex subunit alpha, muscle-specific form-like n=1 Tax=Rousettus aegyptiacus TaxID=9407 RepID=UPI00168CC8D3